MKVNLHQNNGKKKVWSVKHHESNAVAWACMAASGTRSLVFIGDVTADRISRINCEVYRFILSTQIQPNAVKADCTSLQS